jgi:protein-S-isoprenylcysteine O-methyltransferase Ste14
MITGYLKRLFRNCFTRSKNRVANFWRPAYDEKNAIAFLLIKVIYGPIMLSSIISSYNELKELMRWTTYSLPLVYRLDNMFLMFVSGVFLVDATLFAFGYHSESGLFRNKLRFAETNPLRILVCVICYPPFNRVTVQFFGPSNHSPHIIIGEITHPLTWILRAFSFFFLLVLISSSLSLFTKASNLTNRGIVDWGSYRIIRHPGYTAKILFWLTTLLPVLIPDTSTPEFAWSRYFLSCAIIIWGFLGWATIYFLRAMTEEQFLSRDPDYVAYCKKVKYRFIPGVF